MAKERKEKKEKKVKQPRGKFSFSGVKAKLILVMVNGLFSKTNSKIPTGVLSYNCTN